MSEIVLPANNPGLPPDLARRDYLIMGLIGLVHGASHFLQLVLPPLFPFIKDDFQVSYTELGLVMTVFYVVSGISQTPSGFLADRFGARAVLMTGLGLFCTGVMLFALAPSYWLLLPAAVIAGLGNSVFHPADYSILNGSINPARLGRAYGAHTLGGNLGWALAPPLMAAGALAFNWRGAVLVAAIIGFAILLLLVSQRGLVKDDAHSRNKKAEAAGTKSPVQPLGFLSLISVPVLMCFFYFLCAATASVGLQNFLVPVLRELHGTPIATATLAITVMLLCSAAGVVAGGIAADRKIPVPRIVIAGMLGSSLLVLGVGLLTVPDVVIVGMLGLSGFLTGFTLPSRDMIVRDATPRGASGRVFGFVYSGLDAGSATAPLVMGLLLDHGSALGIPVYVASMLALGCFTAVSVRQKTAK